MQKNLLLAKIVEKGFNVGSFCAEANFVRATFDRKMSGMSEFDRSEIEVISEVLELTDEEIINIFFAKLVAKNSNN